MKISLGYCEPQWRGLAELIVIHFNKRLARTGEKWTERESIERVYTKVDNIAVELAYVSELSTQTVILYGTHDAANIQIEELKNGKLNKTLLTIAITPN